MAIIIMFVDLRENTSKLEKYVIDWGAQTTAKNALEKAVGIDLAAQLEKDLESNNPQIIVSWNNVSTDEHSGIGGVGNIEWNLPNNSVLSVVYEDETSTEEQINGSSDWMLKNFDANW